MHIDKHTGDPKVPHGYVNGPIPDDKFQEFIKAKRAADKGELWLDADTLKALFPKKKLDKNSWSKKRKGMDAETPPKKGKSIELEVDDLGRALSESLAQWNAEKNKKESSKDGGKVAKVDLRTGVKRKEVQTAMSEKGSPNMAHATREDQKKTKKNGGLTWENLHAGFLALMEEEHKKKQATGKNQQFSVPWHP